MYECSEVCWYFMSPSAINIAVLGLGYRKALVGAAFLLFMNGLLSIVFLGSSERSEKRSLPRRSSLQTFTVLATRPTACFQVRSVATFADTVFLHSQQIAETFASLQHLVWIWITADFTPLDFATSFSLVLLLAIASLPLVIAILITLKYFHVREFKVQERSFAHARRYSVSRYGI